MLFIINQWRYREGCSSLRKAYNHKERPQISGFWTQSTRLYPWKSIDPDHDEKFCMDKVSQITDRSIDFSITIWTFFARIPVGCFIYSLSQLNSWGVYNWKFYNRGKNWENLMIWFNFFVIKQAHSVQGKIKPSWKITIERVCNLNIFIIQFINFPKSFNFMAELKIN